MDFEKPMRKIEGFIVYSLILDYLDTYIHEYNYSRNEKEFPSLRLTADMFLNLLQDLKEIDISNLPPSPEDAIPELERLLNKYSETSEKDVITSRQFGLFNDSKEKKEEPAKNLQPMSINAQDITWLKSVGMKG